MEKLNNTELVQESVKTQKELIQEYSDLTEEYDRLLRSHIHIIQDVFSNLSELKSISDRDDVFARTTTVDSLEIQLQELSSDRSCVLKGMKSIVEKISEQESNKE